MSIDNIGTSASVVHRAASVSAQVSYARVWQTSNYAGSFELYTHESTICKDHIWIAFLDLWRHCLGGETQKNARILQDMHKAQQGEYANLKEMLLPFVIGSAEMENMGPILMQLMLCIFF